MNWTRKFKIYIYIYIVFVCVRWREVGLEIFLLHSCTNNKNSQCSVIDFIAYKLQQADDFVFLFEIESGCFLVAVSKGNTKLITKSKFQDKT